MNSLSKLTLVALLALGMSGGAAADVDEILSAHFNAVGGLDRLSEIKTVKRSGDASLSGAFGDMSGTIEEAVVVGKKSYSKMDFGAFAETTIWNGMEGWKSSSVGGITALSGNDLEGAKSAANIDPLQSFYEQGGSFALQQGEDETFQGKECAVIELLGAELVFYIDKASNLIAGMKASYSDSNLGDTAVVIQYSDYVEYGGVMFPNSRKLIVGDGATTIVYTYTKTEVDVELDENTFASPAQRSLAAEPPAAPAPRSHAAPAASLAAEPTAGPTAEQLMAYMDTNGDGKITIDEAPEELKTAFGFVDKNGDGGIDVKEAQVMVDFNNTGQSQSPQEATATDPTAEQLMAYGEPAEPVVEQAERPQPDPPSRDRSRRDYYRVITEQNLFRKLGWEKPGNPFRLVGIVSWSTGARALLTRQGSNMGVYAAAGEEIGNGWTLVSIDGHSVKIQGEEMGEQTLELDLDQSFLGSSGGGGSGRQGGQRKGDGKPNAGPKKEATATHFTAEQAMAYLDKNGDGKITMDEAPEELKAGFGFVDKNGDGGIDVDEAQVMADYNNNKQSQ